MDIMGLVTGKITLDFAKINENQKIKTFRHSSAEECSSRSGSSGGSCANGYGVCCTCKTHKNTVCP